MFPPHNFSEANLPLLLQGGAAPDSQQITKQFGQRTFTCSFAAGMSV